MTYRTIGLEIDDLIYKRAVSKAVSENKTINEILVDLLTSYANKTTPRSSSPILTKPTPAVAPVESTYLVKSGDTLGSISKKMYGSPNKYFIIQKANNIADPRRIWVGQKLVIPVLDDGKNATATTSTVQPTSFTPPTTIPTSISVPGSSSGKNPAPPFEFVGSPNFNRRPQREISAIVVHATANGSLKGVVNWFNRPDAQVSAHYTIGKEGTIVQHVRDEHRAWHAGRSEWQGRKDLNSWSIGIELVNWNNGEDPYPEVQHQATVNLISYLASKYDIKPAFIVAHYDISPGRKTDPKGYDMDRLRREVTARL